MLIIFSCQTFNSEDYYIALQWPRCVFATLQPTVALAAAQRELEESFEASYLRFFYLSAETRLLLCATEVGCSNLFTAFRDVQRIT